MKRILATAALGVLFLAGLAGCSGTSRVECKVTLNGTPLEGAVVTFHPEDKEAATSTGTTDSSGVCLMSTGTKAGVAKGKYKVTVTKSQALDIEVDPKNPMEAMKRAAGGAGKIGRGGPGSKPKLLTPDKYSNAADTPLSVDVPPSGPVVLALEGDAGAPPKK